MFGCHRECCVVFLRISEGCFSLFSLFFFGLGDGWEVTDGRGGVVG